VMDFNEKLLQALEAKVGALNESEKLVNTQAIIIDELSVELEETKTAANLQREEYELQLMSQRTYRGAGPENLLSSFIEQHQEARGVYDQAPTDHCNHKTEATSPLKQGQPQGAKTEHESTIVSDLK